MNNRKANNMNNMKPNNMNNMKPKNAKRMLGLALAGAMLPMVAMAQEAPTTTGPAAEATTEPAAEAAAAPVAGQAAESGAGAGQPWDWAVTSYVWASSIGLDVRKDGAPPVGSETDFDDLLSKLDWSLQMHVEGQGDRFGMFGDVTYIALSNEKDHPVYSSDNSLNFSMFELAGVWNVDPARFEGVDLFAGIRYIGVETEVKLDPVDPAKPNVTLKTDEGFSDFMVGVRYNATLSDRWGMTLRADGGFGDTESDYSVSALLRYQMKKGVMSFGYRYLEVETASDSLTVDTVMKGPVFAYTYRF